MAKKDKKPKGERTQRVKETVSAAAQAVKGKVNKVTQTVKVKIKDYEAALQAAHDEGFQSGWEAHENLPKVPGARAAATVGYSKGIKARAKHNKAQEHLNNSKLAAPSAKRQTAKR